MELRARIEEHGESLSDADRRLAGVVLTDPTAAAFLSADELGDRVGVHATTVVRFARKLGFGGYPGLRSALEAEVKERAGAADRVERRLQSTADGGLMSQLVESEIETLSALGRQVTDEQLVTAAMELVGSRRVLIFARGHATALADLAERRLRRLGLSTGRLDGSEREIAEDLVSLDSSDVVLVFALRVTPPDLDALLETAQEVGARVVLVADAVGPTITPRPSVLLAASRGDDSDFQSLTVPMAILNALVLTLAREDRERSMEALQRVDTLIERFTTR